VQETLVCFKFSVPAISDIYDRAERYKEPFKLLRAISLYRNLEEIEEECDNFENSKMELGSRVKELNEQLLDIKGKIKAMKASVDGILTSASSEINRAFKDSISAITNAYQQQIGLMKKESEEYAIRAGQAKTLEQELKWARIIFSITKVPAEARNLSPDFALIRLDTVTRFCYAKGMNPTISVEESLISTQNLLGENSEIHTLSLINGAKRALHKIIVSK
jgi:DNA-binding transcriptional MerR regulator